ncbi:MAG: hypothetical protein ACR2RD_14560 [Woeseiaceae bacterium]
MNKKAKSTRKPLQKKSADSTVDKTTATSGEERPKKRKPSAKKNKSTKRKLAHGHARQMKRRRGSHSDDDANSLAVADLRLGTSSDTEIPEQEQPLKPVRRRKIHKRRKIPRVKKGKAVEDPKPSPRIDIKGH